MKSAGFTILDFTINGIILGPFTENRLREKLKKSSRDTTLKYAIYVERRNIQYR